MNGFTHALPYLENANFAVGCCLPDWLSICDRKCRAREKNALRLVDDSDPVVATVARGVVQHHHDDAWFHATPKFNRLMLEFAVELKGVFGNERTMRPRFVGHILVELLLDAYLSSRYPGSLEFFYQQVARVDSERIQAAVNRFATRPTDRLAGEIKRFIHARYLFDYDTNSGIVFRINQVLKRVRLEPLDERIMSWLPGARARVYKNATDLLPNYRIGL
jgi:hypothetical protein